MKNLILDTAKEQLSSGGYRALNFGQIASEFQTTRANLHHHFGNKHGLAKAATLAYVDDSLQAVRDMASKYPADFDAFLDAIEAMILASRPNEDESQACICLQLLLDDDSPGDLKEIARAFFAEKRQIMAGIVRASQASGKIPKDRDADQLALRASVVLMGISANLQVHTQPDKAASSLKGMLTQITR